MKALRYILAVLDPRPAIVTVRTYLNLRRMGLTKAWEISGMAELGDRLVGALCWAIGIIGVLYLLSDQANAYQHAADNRAAATIAKQQADIDAMLKIIAACFGDREGRVFVGDEMHLCHAYPTGAMK